jgi:hypothetical protein
MPQALPDRLYSEEGSLIVAGQDSIYKRHTNEYGTGDKPIPGSSGMRQIPTTKEHYDEYKAEYPGTDPYQAGIAGQDYTEKRPAKWKPDGRNR